LFVCFCSSSLPIFLYDELFLFSNFIPTGTVSWRAVVQASISLDQPRSASISLDQPRSASISLDQPRLASISLDYTVSFPEVLVAAILVSPPNCLIAAFDALLCFQQCQNPPQSVKIDLDGSPTSCGGHPRANGSRRGPKTCLGCSYNSLREGSCNGHSREVKEPRFWHAGVKKQCKQEV